MQNAECRTKKAHTVSEVAKNQMVTLSKWTHYQRSAGAGNGRLPSLAMAQGAKPRLGPPERSSTSGHVYDTPCCKSNTTARRFLHSGVHDNVWFASLLRTEPPKVGLNVPISFTFLPTAMPKRFRLTMPLIHQGSEVGLGDFRHGLLIGLQAAPPLNGEPENPGSERQRDERHPGETQLQPNH